MKTILQRTRILPILSILWVLAVFLSVRGSFMDDAYIGFEYVGNLYHGEGLVFNPGHRVEGVTNIGWVLLLAAFGWIASIPVAAKFTSLLLVLLTLLLLHGLARSIGVPRNGLLAGLTLAGTAASFDFTFFSFTGMETSLFAFLLILALWLAASGSMLKVTAVLAAAFLVRPETAVIAPLWLVLSLFSGRERRRETLICLAACVLMVASITAIRYAYYGDLLPNTFTAKSTTPGEFLSRMGDLILHPLRITNISSPFATLPALGLIAAGAVALLRRGRANASRLGVSILVTGLLFALYAAPDWTGTGRYFAPYIPVGFLFFFLGAAALLRSIRLREGWMIRTAFAGLFLVTAGTGVYETIRELSSDTLNGYPGFVMTSETLVPACAWMAENLPEGSCIATKRIGCVAFSTDMYVLDCKFGLTERDVAVLVRENGGGFALPTDPRLEDVWLEHKPDYFLEDSDIIAQLADSDDGSVTIHGLVYETIREFPLAPGLTWVLLAREPFDIWGHNTYIN